MHLRHPLLVVAGVLCCGPLQSQVSSSFSTSVQDEYNSETAAPSTDGEGTTGNAAAPVDLGQDDRKYRARVTQVPLYDWWRHPGVSLSLGVNGIGVDVAEAVRDRINVRIGGEFLRYTGEFTESNAIVDADLRLGGGHAGIDVFLFKRSTFHVSPQVRFGILTRGFGTVTIPPGVAVDFNGRSYSSTATDPLRGTASLSTRKAAPGISVGFGNLVPRTRDRHWTVPVDVGFYYIGQPNLQITFVGTACSAAPNQPQGCDNVAQDSVFQQNLQKVIEHQRHNLSYASLFPILSVGAGYRF